MAISFTIMALSSYVVHSTSNLFVLELMFLLIDATGNINNICSTVCISRMHLTKAEPWMKSLHLCYGIGAFITPLLISAFGVKSYFLYTFVAIPFVVFMLFTKEFEPLTMAIDVQELQ